MKQNKIDFFAYNLSSDSENNKLSGYAVVFDSNSKLMSDYAGEYYTRIDKNAFDESENRDVKLLLEHSNQQILAREQNGSLKFYSDDTGLRFEASLGKSMLQRDVVELVSQGIYSQMSFGVIVRDEKWETYEDKPAVRTITKGDLLEFSIVSEPAFEDTNLMVASAEDLSRKAYLENLEKEKEEEQKRLQKEQEEVEKQNLILAQKAKLIEIESNL